MRNRNLRGLSLALSACVFVVAIAILNIGTMVSAQECPSGGGGGGGRPSPSPSPSETEDDPLPIPPIPPEEEESPSPSPSPTRDGGGGAAKCDSEITIAYKKNRFKGKVTSDHNRCKKARAVKVKKKGKKRPVGRSVTNRKGKWKVPEPDANGRYFAKVSKRKVGNIVCKAAKSRTIRV